MVADVQSWLDEPSGNHGWCVVGDETTAPSAKRFDSREHFDPAMRPVLTVDYTAGVQTVVLQAGADNTLYEDPAGGFSNGAGAHLFAGKTLFDLIRRGLVRFEVGEAVPPGARITGAQLRLHMSKTIVGPKAVGLHRVERAWGEGPSDAPGEEGEGAPAEPGDATWLHTFAPALIWNDMGGDFESTPSATEQVDDVGFYTWGCTPGMIADVQHWIDNPGENFGWCIVADEQDIPTAKRFDSRENEAVLRRPKLLLQYTGGPVVETLCPETADSFERVFGDVPVGDALATCESDDERLVVPNRFRVAPTLPFVRVEIWANSCLGSGGVTAIDYRVEAGVTALAPGGQAPDTMRTSIHRDREPAGFILIDERATADAFEDEVVTHRQEAEADKFIRASDGQVRVRVDAFDPGAVLNANWELRIDQYQVMLHR
jgi:hypothetical protein